MKIFQRDTNGALTKAKDDLAAVDQALIDLQQKRLAQLVDSEASEIEKLDFEISAKHRQRQVYVDKIAQLEARLATEDAEKRKKDYAAAVDKLAAPLQRRAAAAERFEQALAAIGRPAREFVAASKAVTEAWPAGVEWPPVYTEHYLSTRRLGSHLQAVFVPFVVVDPKTRRPIGGAEFTARVLEADKYTAGFAAEIRELQAEFLASMRNPGPGDDAEPEQIEAA